MAPSNEPQAPNEPLNNEQPLDNSNGSDDQIKNIQQTTGKLAQQMRDSSTTLQAKDLKYVLNSIISASNINQLDDSDKNDIIAKIKSANIPNQNQNQPITN